MKTLATWCGVVYMYRSTGTVHTQHTYIHGGQKTKLFNAKTNKQNTYGTVLVIKTQKNINIYRPVFYLFLSLGAELQMSKWVADVHPHTPEQK